MKYAVVLLSILILTVRMGPVHGQDLFGLGPVSSSETVATVDDWDDHEWAEIIQDKPQQYEDQWVTTYEKVPVYSKVKHCQNGVCWYEDVLTGYEMKAVKKKVRVPVESSTPVEASPTPMADVRQILAVLSPKSSEVIVDYGCGDARFLIEAANTYGCRGIGVEIDPQRAANAKRLVADAGLTHRIKIVCGDATQLDVRADIGVAYLYSETLTKLRPRIQRLKRFVSYQHSVDGLEMQQIGDSFYWQQPVRQATRTVTRSVQSRPVQTQAMATWGGQMYSGPVCNNPRCRMCNSIRSQLR